MLAVLVASFWTLALGKPQWSASHPDAVRRLGLEITTSHNDTSNAACIVGGFDTDNPAMIYVGGPCSELNDTADGPAPSANFRWVEMQTLHTTIQNHEGDEAPFAIYGTPYMHAQDHTAYAEVGVSATMSAGGDVPRAALFASTTSYLSRASFDYKENTFVLGPGETADTYTTIDLCIAKCCAAPPCDCSGECLDAYKSTATPGAFKYSLLAAAFDETAADTTGTTPAYASGASGNGWERVLEDFGTGSPKQLQGNLMVYQMIDFTNMQADTLTVTSPEGNAVMYKDMEEFACNATACKGVYGVASMTVTSGSWSGTYSFPQTYNRGFWSSSESGITGMITDTKIVAINLVKFDSTMLTSWGLQGKKVVFLEYRFDITGVMANSTMGGFMVYDPTVTSGSGGSGGDSGSTTGTGHTTGDHDHDHDTSTTTGKATVSGCESVFHLAPMVAALLTGFLMQ